MLAKVARAFTAASSKTLRLSPRVRDLIAKADEARDGRNYPLAALLYEQALRAAPRLSALHTQCGHMFKESGRFAEAEGHYLEAQRLAPEDPDLALQLGHFYKVAGRPAESANAYKRAAELNPGWEIPLRELAELRRNGAAAPEVVWAGDGPYDVDLLAPELAPRPIQELRLSVMDAIHIRRLGARRERSRWGMMPALRGVEAIRGYCISSSPIVEMQVFLDQAMIHREPVQIGQLAHGSAGQGKYVFNAWVDFSPYAHGSHRMTLRFMNGQRMVRSHAEPVVVGPRRLEADFPDSNAAVEVSADDPRPVEAQVRSRPSVVRPARRSPLAQPPRNVLVMRTDQLGDLVISVPALRQLRALLPQARLVGLLSGANADLARTLSLFDEIIVIEFPEDDVEHRRLMPLEAQKALRARLAPYNFDIAIDMCEGGDSRPLLLLSGARFLYGFHDREWPWLNGGFSGATPDPCNGLEMAAQSTRVMGFVERLGASLSNRAEVVRRTDLTPDALVPLGLAADERYAVLHAGARLPFARWPHFAQLAARLLDETDLRIVLVTDDPEASSALPVELRSRARVTVIDQRLQFDVFDGLLSFCTVFIGNDSGPKHLAALRGAPVVSIHSGRLNWNEWGQEQTGLIISRRVPCSGCVISAGDECGKQFACMADVSAEEVFAAALQLFERRADERR
jgi:ADP-heptose:LPS heptosyltransferase